MHSAYEKETQPILVDEFDLFSDWGSQMSHVKSSWTDYPTTSNLEQPSSPLEFYIAKVNDEYIQLRDSYLKITFKIRKMQNDVMVDMPGDELVSLTNNFAHTMFDKMELSLNNTIVSTSHHTYGYRNHMENLTAYTREYLETQAQRQMYYEDTPGKMDSTNLPGANREVNEGWVMRRKFIANSRECEVEFRPSLALFQQSKPILNNVDVRLMHILQNPNFVSWLTMSIRIIEFKLRRQYFA